MRTSVNTWYLVTLTPAPTAISWLGWATVNGEFGADVDLAAADMATQSVTHDASGQSSQVFFDADPVDEASEDITADSDIAAAIAAETDEEVKAALVESELDGADVAELAEYDKPDLDVAAETPAERRERFDKVITDFMNPLYGHAMRLTRNEHDAADLVQVTFERAFRKFDSYQPGTNLKAWLFRIQTNAFINEYRRKKRQPKLADGEQVEDWQMHRAESHNAVGLRSAETEVLEALPEQVIVEALDALSADYRQVVLLADVEGLRYKEIAEIMDTPVGTVMSRLHRGRAQLRKRLEDYARAHGYLRTQQEAKS